MGVSDRRVIWMTNSLGYGDDLLYWGPILSQYVRVFPKSQFFTAANECKPIPDSNHAVQRLPAIRVPLGRRRFSYDRHVRLVSPTCIRKIARLGPDALVISEFTMPSLLATRIRQRYGTPTLLLVESDPLRGNPHRLGLLKRKLRAYISRRVDWVLTNNEAGREYIQNHLPIPTDRILCSPYIASQLFATDSSWSPREELGDATKLVFLYVGQLIERKGLAQLMEAISYLTAPQRQKCCFWLIGDGPERQRLEQQIHHRELTDVVRILGRRSYQELCAYYRAADVFVMPTLDDYRALVGFEALSYGLPLMHSCHDGAAEEIVDEGQNGFVVDPRSLNSLVDGIQRFIGLGKNLQSFGEHSLRLSQRFTVKTAVNSLVEATHRCWQAT
jgi:glycosyltransferase involved in cell wall biosynthesis